MSLAGILVHDGEAFEYEKLDTRNAQGERVTKPAKSLEFKCCLFLPNAPETATVWSRKIITVPTLLHMPIMIDGQQHRVNPGSELYVTAPELAAYTDSIDTGGKVKWYVSGFEQPAGKPGRIPKVVLARLSRTSEG